MEFRRVLFRSIIKNGILYIFCCAKGYCCFLTGFGFPFGNYIKPKLYKLQWSCKFSTDKLDHIFIVGKIIQALANIGPIVLPSDRNRNIVKHIGPENAFVTGKVYWFRKSEVIDVIRRTPGTIHPVGSCFDDIMLEKVFME